ncbi:MAG: hypothetical protein ABIH34_04410 [Nanoarchaeota archaeon]
MNEHDHDAPSAVMDRPPAYKPWKETDLADKLRTAYDSDRVKLRDKDTETQVDTFFDLVKDVTGAGYHLPGSEPEKTAIADKILDSVLKHGYITNFHKGEGELPHTAAEWDAFIKDAGIQGGYQALRNELVTVLENVNPRSLDHNSAFYQFITTLSRRNVPDAVAATEAVQRSLENEAYLPEAKAIFAELAGPKGAKLAQAHIPAEQGAQTLDRLVRIKNQADSALDAIPNAPGSNYKGLTNEYAEKQTEGRHN